MGPLGNLGQIMRQEPDHCAVTDEGEETRSELATLCKQMASILPCKADLGAIVRRLRLIGLVALVSLSVLFYIGASNPLKLSTTMATLFGCILIIGWVTKFITLINSCHKEFKACGAHEVELTAFQQAINNHRHALAEIDLGTFPANERRLAVETFLSYALHFVALSRLEQKSGIPLTNRKYSRYGHEYLGVFEPDVDVLMALGRLILTAAEPLSASGYVTYVASLSCDLWILRTKVSENAHQRKTMADADYVAVQAQFVEYLGRYGDAGCLRVLGTLARDKRYCALQVDAKQAIAQVKSRIAGANDELLHIPSPSHESDLLHTGDDHGISK